MPQPFLHHQQRVTPPGLCIHDPVWMQPGGCETGGEQIVPFEHPEHLALDPSQDAGGEQGGGGAMLGIGAGSSHFVQRAARQAAARHRCVDHDQAEGKWRWRIWQRAAALEPGNGIVEFGDAAVGAKGVHGVVLILF